MAIPNAVLTFLAATVLQQLSPNDSNDNAFNEDGTSSSFDTDATSKAAQSAIGAFTIVMLFILFNRSRTSYNRWWEGGTLLQKTRGEWFNAYSSIMAFTSTKPELHDEVESYCHLMARLFSLLMCCGLQQVSPHRDRPFEIIDLAGIEAESMEFLNSAPDKVEVILQWIQRSLVLQMETGVLPVAPPVLSRAFQEVSRGIVNLQNARKIADFPYPFPLAQVSMILQLLHWLMTPIASAFALPRAWAVLLSFFSIFVLWCIHFNALDLEFPFGDRVNDLPMNEFQQDWNNSLITLLDGTATRPPIFKFDSKSHNSLTTVMSDASDQYIPKAPPPRNKGNAVIRVAARVTVRTPPIIRDSVNSEDPRRSSNEYQSSSSGHGASVSFHEHQRNSEHGDLDYSVGRLDSERSDVPAAIELRMREEPDIVANDATEAIGSITAAGSTPSSSSQATRSRVHQGGRTSQIVVKPTEATPASSSQANRSQMGRGALVTSTPASSSQGTRSQAI